MFPSRRCYESQNVLKFCVYSNEVQNEIVVNKRMPMMSVAPRSPFPTGKSSSADTGITGA